MCVVNLRNAGYSAIVKKINIAALPAILFNVFAEMPLRNVKVQYAVVAARSPLIRPRFKPRVQVSVKSNLIVRPRQRPIERNSKPMRQHDRSQFCADCARTHKATGGFFAHLHNARQDVTMVIRERRSREALWLVRSTQ